jgi:hypothetical protein
MFMGATEEQMQILHDANVTHVSYILILFSVAFLLFLCKLRPTLLIRPLLISPSREYAYPPLCCLCMGPRLQI